MLRHHWTRARCRILWVATAALLYVPFFLLTEHR